MPAGRVDTTLQGQVDAYPNPTLLTSTSRTALPAVNPGSRPQLPSTAIFNIPLSDTQPLYSDQRLAFNLGQQATWRNVPNAEGIHIPYSTPYWTTADGGAFSTPFYVMDPATPRQRVWCNRTRRLPYQTILDRGVPLPDPAQLPNGKIGASGSDGSCAIICGNEFWDFFVFAPAPAGSVAANSGYAWQCTQGGYIADLTTYQPPVGSETYATYKGGMYAANWGWGVSASGMMMLGARLMAEDYWRGTIPHALVFGSYLTGAPDNIPTTLFPTQMNPATRHDIFNFTGTANALVDKYRIPEGAWFRLPPGFDTVAWANSHHTYGTTYVVEMVCRALRDYGMMLNDSSGVLGFGCEGNNSFGTPYNPWSAAQAPFWGHFGVDLPWDQFQHIAPRVA